MFKKWLKNRSNEDDDDDGLGLKFSPRLSLKRTSKKVGESLWSIDSVASFSFTPGQLNGSSRGFARSRHALNGHGLIEESPEPLEVTPPPPPAVGGASHLTEKYHLLPDPSDSPPSIRKQDNFSAISGPVLPSAPILQTLEIVPKARIGQFLQPSEIDDNTLKVIGKKNGEEDIIEVRKTQSMKRKKRHAPPPPTSPHAGANGKIRTNAGTEDFYNNLKQPTTLTLPLRPGVKVENISFLDSEAEKILKRKKEKEKESGNGNPFETETPAELEQRYQKELDTIMEGVAKKMEYLDTITSHHNKIMKDFDVEPSPSRTNPFEEVLTKEDSPGNPFLETEDDDEEEKPKTGHVLDRVMDYSTKEATTISLTGKRIPLGNANRVALLTLEKEKRDEIITDWKEGHDKHGENIMDL